MTIPTLPELNRASPTFKTDVDAFFGTQLPAFSAALNPEIQRINDIGFGSYSATSATSVEIGTGAKTLTIETGKGFVIGQAIMIAHNANPDNHMVGYVTGYNSISGELEVNVTSAGGAGTYAAWILSVTAIQSSSAPYVNRHDKLWSATTSSTFTVPAGVSGIRAYVIGKGGDGFGSTSLGASASGAGGGIAYGDIAVTPGEDVTITISAGVCTLTYDGIDLLIANPGSNASFGTGGTGGTASKHASVENGGAYSGGNGATQAPGGASAGSPLGTGKNSIVSAGSGGAGIGGEGGAGGAGGGGAGGAGGSNGPSGGAGGPSVGDRPGPSRALHQRFTDPLLRHAVAPGVGRAAAGMTTANGHLSLSAGPGAGGGGINGNHANTPTAAGAGGDFGGGGGINTSNSAPTGTYAGPGGILGGGGGAYSSVTGSTAYGGNGGIGGGGGGATGVSSGVAGTGGSAAALIFYS